MVSSSCQRSWQNLKKPEGVQHSQQYLFLASLFSMSSPEQKFINKCKETKMSIPKTIIIGRNDWCGPQNQCGQLVRITQVLSCIKQKPFGLAIRFRLEYILFLLIWKHHCVPSHNLFLKENPSYLKSISIVYQF